MNAGQPGARMLAPKAAMTTRENPWPLRLLTENIKTYVEKMSTLWVEGQIVEYKPRPGTRMAFFVLRDVQADTSMTVTAFPSVLDRTGPGFEEGARVVIRATPVFWEKRGTLNLRAEEIHLQGLGDLLAQIEMLRRKLSAEGLFAPERKVPLPFAPKVIGLVCGRNAKAKDDVVVNASARWPAIGFEIREVAVQGVHAVREVCAAMTELDGLSHVDVIVVARGGGSVEDLLPFSDETMVRTAATIRKPLVSAIGHEADAPLLDLVADFRASTPTDAARRVVPDLVQETAGLAQAASRMRSAVARVVGRERERLSLVTSRPVMVEPRAIVERHVQVVDGLRGRLSVALSRMLSREQTGLARAIGTLRALSPQATLDRGYALLRTPGGDLIRSTDQIAKGDLLEGVLASGRLVAQVFGFTPATSDTSASEDDPLAN